MAHQLTSGLTFVLGGARSGKSKFAEDLVLGSELKPVYIATGRAIDEEMSERIAIHQDRRGDRWQTVEEPLALADAIRQSAYKDHAILVDCISIWVTNLMMAKADAVRECNALIGAVQEVDVPVVMVSNEVGLGIVPDNAMAREFRDLAGSVHQQIAAAADNVFFVAAGLPMTLKQAG